LREFAKAQEELDGHNQGLGRDIDTVRSTLNKLDARIQRPGADSSENQTPKEDNSK
jgi:hypothetical protein